MNGTWLWVGMMVAVTGAAAQDREADMFADEAATTVPAPAADDREGGMFGDAEPLTKTAPSPLAAVPVVGGTVFLRVNGNFRLEQTVQEGSLSSPSLIDVYADVRPNDRLRGFAQVRMNYDFTVQPGETNPFTGREVPSFVLALDQAWMKFDIGRVIYVTAGKQRIRWGSGRFWNPTDFVNADIRNSVDFFDQRLGVNLLKFHVPFEALGWNLYLIPVLDGINTIGDIGLAARAEFLFGELELALSSKVKKDQPLRFGADLSAGVWLFDVHAEGALQRGQSKPLFKGKLDFDEGVFPEEIDTDNEWFGQVNAGAEISLNYTDTDTISFGAEYFYNSAGYDDASLYPILFLRGGYVPLFTGRHYGAFYARVANPLDLEDISFTLSTLSNISDLSFLTRFDVQYNLLNYLTMNVFGSLHYGNVGEFRLGIDVPANPLVPGLEDGFLLNTDLFDVGTALRMQF
jgi:hypothetical protein